MSISAVTTTLYFVAAVAFTIASVLFFERARVCVNEKLDEAEKLTFWKIVSKKEAYTRVPFLYKRYYPNGQLAMLFWVGTGFSMLCFAGAAVCLAIAYQ